MDKKHGVAKLPIPTPHEVDVKFQKMHTTMEKTNKKPAYNLARLLSPLYIQDCKFLTMMLRAEQHVAFMAAARLVHYFKRKLDLFGMDCLVCSITLNNLEPHKIELLKI